MTDTPLAHGDQQTDASATMTGEVTDPSTRLGTGAPAPLVLSPAEGPSALGSPALSHVEGRVLSPAQGPPVTDVVTDEPEAQEPASLAALGSPISALRRSPPRRQPYPWNRGRAARLPHNLTQEQTARLLRAARANPRDRALLNLMYRYGLRPGEAGLILMSDLDLPGRRIRIGRLKRGVPKEYPLFEVLVPILEAYLAVRQVPASAPTPLPPEQDFLFPSRQLRRKAGIRGVVGLSAKRVHQIVCAYGARVGIPPTLLRGHCLRHTCGTHLLDAGCGLEDVRDHLGHRSIASTTVYAQITSRRMRERFARLDGSDAIVAP